METPHGANSEEHEVALESKTFSTQESSVEDEGTSEKPDQRGGDLIPSDQRPQLEPDGDLRNLKKSFTCVPYNTGGLREAVSFQETRQVLLDASPDTSQLLVENYLSMSDTSNKDRFFGLPPSAQAAEVQFNQAAQDEPDRSLDIYSGCVQRDFKTLEPISNGSIINQACSSTPEIPAGLLPRTSAAPHVVKQRPSTITFSDSTGSSCINSQASGNDSYDGEGSSEEDKNNVESNADDYGDGNDEVFLEWAHSEDLPMAKKKQKKRGCVGPQAKPVHTCGYEAEEEISAKEESPQVMSPWSASMSQLMRNLDQLNQDIEEALSASSSPSDTPCIARKKQWGAASESTPNQTPNDRVLPRPDRRECLSQDRSSASRSSSTGTSARSKKAMFNKMTKAPGAGQICGDFSTRAMDLCTSSRVTMARPISLGCPLEEPVDFVDGWT